MHCCCVFVSGIVYCLHFNGCCYSARIVDCLSSNTYTCMFPMRATSNVHTAQCKSVQTTILWCYEHRICPLCCILHTSFLHSQTYIVPQISLFGDVAGNPNALFNNIRVYGTILLLLMAVIVFVGVKIVSCHFSLSLSCHLHIRQAIYAFYVCCEFPSISIALPPSLPPSLFLWLR